MGLAEVGRSTVGGPTAGGLAAAGPAAGEGQAKAGGSAAEDGTAREGLAEVPVGGEGSRRTWGLKERAPLVFSIDGPEGKQALGGEGCFRNWKDGMWAENGVELGFIKVRRVR